MKGLLIKQNRNNTIKRFVFSETAQQLSTKALKVTAKCLPHILVTFVSNNHHRNSWQWRLLPPAS
jgi:hypothetical protein